MRSLLARTNITVFMTIAIGVLGLVLVINYQVSQNFTSYLHMSNMHGMMMSHMSGMMGAPEQQFLSTLRYSLLAIAGIMLLMGAVASYYLARSIAIPVINLNQAVNDVAKGNLDAAVPVDRQDEIGQLATAFNEMTAKLKANTILRQRFLAGIAHELRTPLTVLKANLEGIADGVIDPTQDQMNSLTEEVDRLAKMVGELRDLSLLEAGQLIPKFAEIDLPTTLRQVAQKSRPLASEKNLVLDLTIDEHVSTVWADPDMLHQMVYNLIMNAIRYTAEGSITLTAKRELSFVTIEVIDTGIGIAAEDVANIFDYFYRVDQSRTKETGGTGLGLALVKQMVQVHNGSISATSTLGKGSIFTIKLPVRFTKNA